MRFPKATREKLHEAGAKPVEIDWPLGEKEPQPHATYTVQSSHRAGEYSILVLFVDETPAHCRAIVRRYTDEVYMLGKSGGYVDRPDRAMPTRVAVDPTPMGGPQFRPEYEPEAVGGAELAALNEGNAEERRARIAAAIDAIEAAIEEAEEVPDLAGSLRFHRGLLLKLKARKLELTPAPEGAA